MWGEMPTWCFTTLCYGPVVHSLVGVQRAEANGSIHQQKTLYCTSSKEQTEVTPAFHLNSQNGQIRTKKTFAVNIQLLRSCSLEIVVLLSPLATKSSTCDL
eukprot:TRINITY_DN68128_c7_g7_i1.p1 TRINITY_DN68128_c7_g7~~TRINITY_DN68128_c7_g7_i1.p1  ORF type:complete len:101 (-),score=0.68 TRINITY_DN68128_c7_g7_i1:53-355(-)